MRRAGYLTVKCDFLYFRTMKQWSHGKKRRNYMDLLTPSGFMLLTSKESLHFLQSKETHWISWCHGLVKTAVPHVQTYFHALLRLAVVLVLKGKARDLITWLGIKCSSFIGLNVGTSGRSPSNPYGNWHFPSVLQSNMLLERSHAMFSGIWHLVFFPGSPMLPF